MSTDMTLAMRDSATMLRRNLRRLIRYPVGAVSAIGTPLVFLLLFVGVLGDTMGAGLLGASGSRGQYLAYIVPGILLLSIAGAAQGVAISVAMDMAEGIINRFRTMAISGASVLTGHVLGNLIQTMAALIVVTGVALLLGYRPEADLGAWIAVAALLTLVSTAIIWLSVAMALAAKSVEGASNLPLPLLLLPFLGSGFVPTDSMPGPLAWFAEYQPFTPIMETLRGLLSGTAVGTTGIVAVAWCVGLTLVGYLGARRLYRRDPRP